MIFCYAVWKDLCYKFRKLFFNSEKSVCGMIGDYLVIKIAVS